MSTMNVREATTWILDNCSHYDFHTLPSYEWCTRLVASAMVMSGKAEYARRNCLAWRRQ